MLDLPENELFSAYIDGELTADEQAEVEQILSNNPDAQQLVDELRSLSHSLQSLPAYKLDEDLASRVLCQAEREMLAQPVTPLPKFHQVDTPSARASSWTRRILRPRNFAWSAVAVAVAGVMMLVDSGNSNNGASNQVARVPGGTVIEPLDIEPTVEAMEQPATRAVAATAQQEELNEPKPDTPDTVAPLPQPEMVADVASEPAAEEPAVEPKKEAVPLLVLQCQLAEGRIGQAALTDLLEQAGVALEEPIADGVQGPVELTLTTAQLRQVISRLQADKDQFTGYAVRSTAKTAAPRIPSGVGPGVSHPKTIVSAEEADAEQPGKVTLQVQAKVTFQPKATANPPETTSADGSNSKAAVIAKTNASRTPKSLPIKDDRTYRVRFVLQPAKTPAEEARAKE